MTKPKLSVALATFNEQANLGRCLDSVKPIADEIIIVDGSSSDQTVAIARKYTSKITVTTNPPIFHINKQKALDQCKGTWILQLDADEVVSPELAQEISQVLALTDQEIAQRQLPRRKAHLFHDHQQLIEHRDGPYLQTGEYAAFFMPRRNLLLGRPLLHGGVYPDGVIRLIKNGLASFPCKSVHEQINISGQVGWLVNDLIHYATPTFSRYLTNSNRYTTLAAQDLAAQGVKPSFGTSVAYLVFKPIGTMFSLFIRHRGFLDGFPGLVFALFSGFHLATSYLKLCELNHGYSQE